MTEERIQYLLNTPREQLKPSDKRLRSIIEKYGSVSNAMQHRDTGDLILSGYNGGIRRVKKGFSKWEDGTLSEYAQSRKRDARGRFIPKENREETNNGTETKREG